jgi:hypothetical protein
METKITGTFDIFLAFALGTYYFLFNKPFSSSVTVQAVIL